MASTAVVTALLSGVQFDGDAQGRVVLAFGLYRNGVEQVRAVDVRDGRPAGRARARPLARCARLAGHALGFRRVSRRRGRRVPA